MSTRSVVVRLEAEVSKFVSGMEQAEDATEKTTKSQEVLGEQTDKTSKQTDKASEASKKDAEAKKKQAEAADTAGKALLGMGGILVGFLGASTKAAMDWESAWTGVLKTVDGTPEQLENVEDGLRDLAKTLPSTHVEIAAVAEAAGQLGIATDDVVDFTKVMIDLGQATNLTAEDAATQLARFMNVMGTSADDVDKLGATLVGLGNNYATTESEIMAMSMRLSGAGRQIGLSEGQVMGLSAAMSSVGIEAEAGGSAMSLTMKRIGKAVDEGDASLDTFAKTSGMTASDFQDAWKEDAAGALESFVLGLGKAGEEGESVNGILTELGITGIRESDALLRLSSAGELMGDAMAQGSQEYADGSALIEEATKRYETAESKVAIAWNNIKDASIDAGASILPVVAGIADSVSGLAQVFGDLPRPTQTAITGMVGLAGGAALVSGAILTLVPKIRDTRDAFRDLSASGSKVPGVMGKIATGAAAATAAFALWNAAIATHNSTLETKGLGEFSLALQQIGDDSKNVDSLFKGLDFGDSTKFEGQVNGIQDALRELNRGGMDHFGADMGANNGIKILRDNVDGLDKTMASAVSSGNPEAAAKAWDQLTVAAEQQGVGIDKLKSLFPEYNDSLAGAEAASKGAAGGTDELADAQSLLEEELESTGIALDGVISDMDKFLEQLFASGMLTRDERGAMRDYEAAIDAVSESIKKNGQSLDITTEKGRANQAAFDGLSASGQAVVESMASNGASQEEIQGHLSQTYDDLIRAAGQFGVTGDKADAMARDVLGIPDDVKIDTWISDAAKKGAESTKAAIDAIPKSTTVYTHYKTSGQPGGGPLKVTPRDLIYGDLLPQKAAGGDLDMAPGPKGVDSQLFYGAKGEHVFTDKDVDAMGGQQAVYRFRASLHSGVPAYANGGVLGVASTSIMATNQVARGDSSGSAGPLFAEGAIQVNGATDAARVAQAVEDKITNKLAKVGMRIG